MPGNSSAFLKAFMFLEVGLCPVFSFLTVLLPLLWAFVYSVLSAWKACFKLIHLSKPSSYLVLKHVSPFTCVAKHTALPTAVTKKFSVAHLLLGWEAQRSTENACMLRKECRGGWKLSEDLTPGGWWRTHSSLPP